MHRRRFIQSVINAAAVVYAAPRVAAHVARIGVREPAPMPCENGIVFGGGYTKLDPYPNTPRALTSRQADQEPPDA